jgi:hypothetical protein
MPGTSLGHHSRKRTVLCVWVVGCDWVRLLSFSFHTASKYLTQHHVLAGDEHGQHHTPADDVFQWLLELVDRLLASF